MDPDTVGSWPKAKEVLEVAGRTPRRSAIAVLLACLLGLRPTEAWEDEVIVGCLDASAEVMLLVPDEPATLLRGRFDPPAFGLPHPFPPGTRFDCIVTSGNQVGWMRNCRVHETPRTWVDVVPLSPGVHLRGIVRSRPASLALKNAVIEWRIERQPVLRTMSGEDGNFVLGPLPACRIQLHVRAERHAAMTLQCSPLSSGRFLIELPVNGEIEGRLNDQGGAPVSSARVTARSLRLRGSCELEAISDARGRFQIKELPQGYAALSIDAPGFEPRTLPVVHTDIVDLQVTMTPSALVRTQIVGRLAGDPLPIRVSWHQVNDPGDVVRTLPSWAWIEGEILSARAPFAGQFRLEVPRAGAGSILTPVFRCEPGQEIDLGAVLEPDAFRVRGFVKDKSGLSPNGHIALAPVPSRQRSGSALLAPRSRLVALDSNGAFELEAVERGRYLLSVEAHRCASRHMPIEIAGELNLGGLCLATECTLDGIVEDSLHRPVAEALVTITNTDGISVEHTTDAHGRFTARHLEPTRYDLTAAAPDAAPMEMLSFDRALGGTSLPRVVTLKPEERATITLVVR